MQTFSALSPLGQIKSLSVILLLPHGFLLPAYNTITKKVPGKEEQKPDLEGEEFHYGDILPKITLLREFINVHNDLISINVFLQWLVCTVLI